MRSLSLLLLGSMLIPALVLAEEGSGDSSSSSSSVSSGSSSSTSSSSSSSVSSSSSISSRAKGRRTLPDENRACIQTAVDTREQAILTGLSAFTTSLQSAFSQRKIALHDAWGIADTAQRKAAIKSTWMAFKQSKQLAQKTFRTARRTAWTGFKTAARKCGETSTDEMFIGNEEI